MSLDLQVTLASFEAVIQSSVQQQFYSTCFPQIGQDYVDHIDVASISGGAGGLFTLLANVFVVTDAQLASNINGTPPSATSPKGQYSIDFQLGVQGATISLVCSNVSSPDTELNLFSEKIKETIGSLASVDLSSTFSELGLPAPTSSAIATVGPTLVIRFDPPSSPPVNHLSGNADWCAFIDAATVCALTKAKFDKGVGTSLNGLAGVSETVKWAPSGGNAHVDITIAGNYPVPDPLVAKLTVHVGTDFQLGSVAIPPAPVRYGHDLNEIDRWSLDVVVSDIGIGFVDDAIYNWVTSLATAKLEAALNPSAFGGTKISDQSFSTSQLLDEPTFGSAQMVYQAVSGLPDGMVLSGRFVGLPALGETPFSFAVNPFPARFTYLTDCLGGPNQPLPTVGTVFVSASCIFSNYGTVCSGAMISPTSGGVDLTPYVSVADGSVSITLSGLMATAVAAGGQDVQILLITSRGVRQIDFGLPPKVVSDKQGNVTNADDRYINDCPGNPVPWSQVFGFFNPLWGPDPEQQWVEQIDTIDLFLSTVVTVEGQSAGEVLLFEQPVDGGLSMFTADEAGLASIPVLLAMRSFDEKATLATTSGRALALSSVSAMSLQRVATFKTPGALSHSIADNGGYATLTTRYARHIDVVQIDTAGIVQRSKPVGYAELGFSTEVAQPTSSKSQAFLRGLPGFEAVLTVPGHESSNLAVGRFSDGRYRLVSADAQGSPRLAGIMSRWIDMPAVQGSWAISSGAGNKVAIFSVKPLTAPKGCGC